MRTKDNIINRLTAALAKSSEFAVDDGQIFALFNEVVVHVKADGVAIVLAMAAKRNGEVVYEKTFRLNDGDEAAWRGFEGKIKIDLSAS